MAVLKPLSQQGSSSSQTATSSGSTRVLKPLSSIKSTVIPTKAQVKKAPTVKSKAPQKTAKKEATKQPSFVDMAISTAKDTAIQTGKDIKNVFTAPFMDITANVKLRLDPKGRAELDKILKSKLSVEEKIKKTNSLAQKYGAQNEEQQASARRGGELGGGFTHAAGNVDVPIIATLKALPGASKSIFSKLIKKQNPPQEILNTVLGNGLEKTPEGKNLLKTALQAQKQGKNVEVKLLEAPKTKQIEAPKPKVESKPIKPKEIVSEETITKETTKKPTYSSKEARTVQESFSNELERTMHGTSDPKEFSAKSEKLINTTIEKLKEDRVALAGIRTSINKQMFDFIGASGNYKQKYAELKTMMGDPDVGEFLQTLEAKVKEIDEMITTTPETVKTITKTVEKRITERPLLEPVGTGEVKQSKQGVRLEAEAISKELTDTLGDLPEYNKLNLEKQANDVIDLMAKDSQRAVDIAMGKKAAPSGVTPEAVWIGVRNKAIQEGDLSMIKQLATSPRIRETTALGQRMVSLRGQGKDDVVSRIQDLIKKREESFAQRYKNKSIDEMKGKVTSDIKRRIKVPDRVEWSRFADSIEC